MPKQSKQRYVRNGGNKNEFMANVPLGKTKIKELFEEGAKILGLSKPNDFFPHSLRSMFITDLANNPHVSNIEAQTSARHSSISATTNYMTRDGLSETNKYVALGMVSKEAIESRAEAALPSDAREDDFGGELIFSISILYFQLRNLHYCVPVKKYFLFFFYIFSRMFRY